MGASSFYGMGVRFDLDENSASGKPKLQRLDPRKTLGAGCLGLGLGSGIRALWSFRLLPLVYRSPALQERKQGFGELLGTEKMTRAYFPSTD